MIRLNAQNKKAVEVRTQQPIAKVIPISLYQNRRRAARTKVIASFAGTNREFQKYLREGKWLHGSSAAYLSGQTPS